jgi:hypothetical protein
MRTLVESIRQLAIPARFAAAFALAALGVLTAALWSHLILTDGHVTFGPTEYVTLAIGLALGGLCGLTARASRCGISPSGSSRRPRS